MITMGLLPIFCTQNLNLLTNFSTGFKTCEDLDQVRSCLYVSSLPGICLYSKEPRIYIDVDRKVFTIQVQSAAHWGLATKTQQQ